MSELYTSCDMRGGAWCISQPTLTSLTSRLRQPPPLHRHPAPTTTFIFTAFRRALSSSTLPSPSLPPHRSPHPPPPPPFETRTRLAVLCRTRPVFAWSSRSRSCLSCTILYWHKALRCRWRCGSGVRSIRPGSGSLSVSPASSSRNSQGPITSLPVPRGCALSGRNLRTR
jgi:hypothetical protein